MKVLPKRVLDIPYQGEMESRRLWNSVTQAIQQPEGPDWDRVQREKAMLGRSLHDRYCLYSVEEKQRALPCHQPTDSPQFKPWKPKFFTPIPHTGKGKMKTGYQFMYFDLKRVRPVCEWIERWWLWLGCSLSRLFSLVSECIWWTNSIIQSTIEINEWEVKWIITVKCYASWL